MKKLNCDIIKKIFWLIFKLICALSIIFIAILSAVKLITWLQNHFSPILLWCIFVFLVFGLIYKNWKYIQPIIKEFKEIRLLYRIKNAPEISWLNDGFAYMTIESRFKDNFNKSTLKFNQGSNPCKDDFSYFTNLTVLDENDFKEIFPEINNTDENKISPKTDYCKNYKKYMNETLEPFKGKKQSYLFSNASFIFAEHYYFYSILYQYLKQNSQTKNPAKTQKLLWNETKEKQYENIEEKIKTSVENYIQKDLGEILKNCVNSNSTDLSQSSINVNSYANNPLVIDDIEAFCDFINNGNNLENKNVHIIVDNCGIEIISDILLGLYLIKKCKINCLYFHFNVIPIFVSDVIKSDINEALRLISNNENDKNRKQIVTDYNEYKNNRKIIESADVFWNMPIPFKDAPKQILNDIFNTESTGLIIFKGDLNYRRLVEDRKWEISLPINEHIKYLKKPVLILRSLKSNVLLGINKKKAKLMDETTPNWKTTGDFGIIQFIEKN